MSLKQKLTSYRKENHILEKITVPEDDSKKYLDMIANNQPLPEGIYKATDYNSGKTYFYYWSDTKELSQDELLELILHAQLKSINTIKKCVIFFAVLTIISLALCFISLIIR